MKMKLKHILILCLLLSTQLSQADTDINLSFAALYKPYTDSPFITDIEVIETQKRSHPQARAVCGQMYEIQKAQLVQDDARKWHAWNKSNVHQVAKFERWWLAGCMISVSAQIQEITDAGPSI
jgi:hypothetical protein